MMLHLSLFPTTITSTALLFSVSTAFRQCYFSSNPKLLTPFNIPSSYRRRAIEQTKYALTEYLHATRSLPYTYADNIIKNSQTSLLMLMSQVEFSTRRFPIIIRKFLRYNPINEFEFFFESIGIDYREIKNETSRHNLLFLSEDQRLFDSACVLSGFGFPWNKLGILYMGEASIFSKHQRFLTARLEALKAAGLSTLAVIGVCLAFPCLLSGERCQVGGENAKLLGLLKRVFVDLGFGSAIEDNVDAWYRVCRKIRMFYEVDFDKGRVEELKGKCKSIFLECPEDVLAEKLGFLCNLGVSQADAGLLILKRPEVLGIDLDATRISLLGFLRHFGIEEETFLLVKKQYPYVFGRNKMIHLPFTLRAMHLDEWFSDRVKYGDGLLLATYALRSPDEGIDENYLNNLEKIKCSRTPFREFGKLNFLHSVGFGENSLTLKVLANIHGSCIVLQEHFNYLLEVGIEFSKLCKMLSKAPKFINQDISILQQKIDFLSQDIGLSLDCLNSFPAYLCYGLEKRIKPRYKFCMLLQKQGWCKRKYSLASIIATSEKLFVARLATIHPMATEWWHDYLAYEKHEKWLARDLDDG